MSAFTTLEQEREVEDRIHWALTHGIGMGQPFVHAPITIHPYHYPSSQFTKAKALAPLFNVLVERIARDPTWLIETLRPTAVSDEFVRRLIEIYEKVLVGGIKQTVSLAITRSDYMLHVKEGDPKGLLQVEINTIASSFGSLSTRIAEMHSELEAFAGSAHQVHNHDALDEIASGLASGHRAYMRQAGRQVDTDLGIAMIVQPGERNFADQRLLQFQLWQNYRVRCYRITLAEMHERGRLQSNGTQDELIIDGICVSVVYFRSGYSPDDHPTEKEWDARLLIEKSYAIKCPTIAYHLAGCKKIQQVLAEPCVLERFVASPTHRDELRSVFAGLYSLSASPDSPEAAALTDLRHKVIAAKGENYVMKPQREGGGNNIYGEDVGTALQTMSVEEQSAYILMERILPPSAPSKLLRNNQLTEVRHVVVLCLLV